MKDKEKKQTNERNDDESSLDEKGPDCWAGYRPGAQSGVKTKISPKTGKRVNNCEKIREDQRIVITKSNLRKLIRESLSVELMSEGLQYHVESKVGIEKNIFRPGSESFFGLFNEARVMWKLGLYEVNKFEKELLESDIGKWGMYEGKNVPLDFPMLYSELNEAEYKGKKVELNEPKRGGGDGKAYVYVNSGNKTKDGKIKAKKVEFGSSMPDAMGDSDEHKKRRKNFGIRHNCSDKKDKTKAGYWSCRLTKFFGRNIPGWW